MTPHTRCSNLYIATAGTGNAWKFLPIIGDHVARMIYEPEQWVNGDDGVFAKMWHWDRKMEDSEDEDVIPKRDLQDLLDSKNLEVNGNKSRVDEASGHSGGSAQ